MLSKSSIIQVKAGQLPFRECRHNPQVQHTPTPTQPQVESNHVVDKFHKSSHRWLSKGGLEQNHGNSISSGAAATITFDSGEKQFSFFLCCVTLCAAREASTQASLFGSLGSWRGRASYLWHLHIFCITQSMASTWKICLPYSAATAASLSHSFSPALSLSLSLLPA